MYHVSAQGVDERMINVHHHYYSKIRVHSERSRYTDESQLQQAEEDPLTIQWTPPSPSFPSPPPQQHLQTKLHVRPWAGSGDHSSNQTVLVISDRQEEEETNKQTKNQRTKKERKKERRKEEKEERRVIASSIYRLILYRIHAFSFILLVFCFLSFFLRCCCCLLFVLISFFPHSRCLPFLAIKASPPCTNSLRAQERCESGGGRPGLPTP